ncbi:MAG: alpha/beta hydrolase [Gammaproteobacteria bacterium]|nr:alpha/beta hydrolase [Gammaproteobacteria bacterium]
MTDKDAAVTAMITHLDGIARRVSECAGDVGAIRAVIEDYSRLDEATRRVDARTITSKEPAGEWVLADGAQPEKRVLYVHGGSWMSGSADGYRPLAAQISRESGCSVFVLDYRLAPEHPYPAGLEDCVAAWRWLSGNGPQSGSAARKQVIAGDSAGGNLALATALRLKDDGGRTPDAVVALSPAVDLTWQSPSLRTRARVDPILRPDRLHLVSQVYVQDAERMDHPWVSPLFGDFTGLPRSLIQVGDREVLLDDAKRIAGRMKEQGVDVELQVYEGMPHVFQLFAPTVAASTDAVERIGGFVRSAG